LDLIQTERKKEEETDDFIKTNQILEKQSLEDAILNKTPGK